MSLSAYPAYYWLSWKDGRSPTPERLFRSVIPAEDLATRDWLTENATYSDLVLAPVPRVLGLGAKLFVDVYAGLGVSSDFMWLPDVFNDGAGWRVGLSLTWERR